MNKKQAERIATIALVAFLVGLFCYQVAYGLSLTRASERAYCGLGCEINAVSFDSLVRSGSSI